MGMNAESALGRPSVALRSAATLSPPLKPAPCLAAAAGEGFVSTRTVLRGALGYGAPGSSAAAPLRDFGMVVVVHGKADAEAALALADRLRGICGVATAELDQSGALLALGVSVAVVAVWSAHADREGLGPVISVLSGPGRVAVVAALDSTPLPAALQRHPLAGPALDPVVLGGLVFDAVSSAKTLAGQAALAIAATPEQGTRGGFIGGIAASVAVFGFAGVAGHVFLPAVASEGRMPVADAITATSVAENAHAVAPSLRTIFVDVAEADFTSDHVVSARFGAEMRVAFQGAPQPVAPVLRPVPVAAKPSTAPALEVASSGAVAPISTVQGSEPIFGAPILMSDRLDVPPAFITDMQTEEPVER